MYIVKEAIIDRFLTRISTGQKVLLFASVYAVIRALVYFVSYYAIYKKYKVARQIQKDKMDRSILEINEICLQNPISTENRMFLDEADATDLMTALKDRRITSVETLVYYLDRCVRLGVQANAIVDFNHLEALEMAMMCDELRKVTPSGRLPPLFGLPCSLKSNYVQKGFDTSLDLVKYHNVVHEKDGELVEVIKKLGCIPFARTNIPSGCCATENLGYVYGTVQNPV